MAQTSIHIQPVKPGSEAHNKREKDLDYVRKDLSHLNEYWQSCSQGERLEQIKNIVKERTKRTMQSKATPIREAVIVIDKDTTMQQLQELARKIEAKFGIHCFQIAAHRDEGYMNAKKWTPNLHAHFVFDWTDHQTGKSYKLNREDMVEMQTMVAKELNMERGKSSDKKHLNAIQFKMEAEKKRLEKINTARESKEAVVKTLNFAVEGAKSLFGVSDRDKVIKSLRSEKNTLQENFSKQEEEAKKEKEQIIGSAKALISQVKQKSRSETEAIRKEIGALREENSENRARADFFTSLWASSPLVQKGMQAMIALANDISRRSFTQEEVADIDSALGANETSIRKRLANELIRIVKGLFPKRIMLHGRLDAQRQDLQNIAEGKPVRQQQNRGLRR